MLQVGPKNRRHQVGGFLCTESRQRALRPGNYFSGPPRTFGMPLSSLWQKVYATRHRVPSSNVDENRANRFTLTL